MLAPALENKSDLILIPLKDGEGVGKTGEGEVKEGDGVVEALPAANSC